MLLAVPTTTQTIEVLLINLLSMRTGMGIEMSERAIELSGVNPNTAGRSTGVV